MSDNKTPAWDLFPSAAARFNTKAAFAFVLVCFGYALNTVATFVSFATQGETNVGQIGITITILTILSFAATLSAVIMGHKALREIKENKERGIGFVWGALSAGYVSLFTVQIIFFIMDYMYLYIAFIK